MNYRNKSWMKHISLNFPFIRAAPKCTKISDKFFGGVEWKEKLLNLFHSVIHVREWKLVIWKLLELSNLCQFHPGSGKISVWILFWAYPTPLNTMIPSGLLLTGSQRPLILFQCIRNIEPRSMLKFISIELSAYMVYQKPLSQIVVLSLCTVLGATPRDSRD